MTAYLWSNTIGSPESSLLTSFWFTYIHFLYYKNYSNVYFVKCISHMLKCQMYVYLHNYTVQIIASTWYLLGLMLRIYLFPFRIKVSLYSRIWYWCVYQVCRKIIFRKPINSLHIFYRFHAKGNSFPTKISASRKNLLNDLFWTRSPLSPSCSIDTVYSGPLIIERIRDIHFLTSSALLHSSFALYLPALPDSSKRSAY